MLYIQGIHIPELCSLKGEMYFRGRLILDPLAPLSVRDACVPVATLETKSDTRDYRFALSSGSFLFIENQQMCVRFSNSSSLEVSMDISFRESFRSSVVMGSFAVTNEADSSIRWVASNSGSSDVWQTSMNFDIVVLSASAISYDTFYGVAGSEWNHNTCDQDCIKLGDWLIGSKDAIHFVVK